MLWEHWFSQTLRKHLFLPIFCIIGAPVQILGNNEYYFFLRLRIISLDIFRQLILQRIRIKDSLGIFKDEDKDL